MTPEQWKTILFFNPEKDKFGDPGKMDYRLLKALDRLRAYADKPIMIHCGYESRPMGYHPRGMAVDCHIVGLSLFDQFILALRFKDFTGIGVYPFWNNPGLHLDIREVPIRAVWGSTGRGEYTALTVDLF